MQEAQQQDAPHDVQPPASAPSIVHDIDQAIRAERQQLLVQKQLLDAQAKALHEQYHAHDKALKALQSRCKHPYDQRHKPFAMYAETEWHCPSCGRVYI